MSVDGVFRVHPVHFTYALPFPASIAGFASHVVRTTFKAPEPFFNVQIRNLALLQHFPQQSLPLFGLSPQRRHLSVALGQVSGQLLDQVDGAVPSNHALNGVMARMMQIARHTCRIARGIVEKGGATV